MNWRATAGGISNGARLINDHALALGEPISLLQGLGTADLIRPEGGGLAHRSQRDYRVIHAASFDEISVNGCAPIPGILPAAIRAGHA